MIAFFVKRKVATSMIYAAILLVGAISVSKVPITLLPNMVIPRLIVLTQYPYVSAGEIDNLVTATLESTISSVNGVKSMKSRSEEGLSVIYVDLSWGYDIDMAILSIRQKLDLVRNMLPQDTQRPVILKYDPNNEPVIKLLVKPKNINYLELRDYLDKNIKPELERITGVASVIIHGGEKREIKILVDAQELYAVKSSLKQIGDTVGGSNYNFPAGNVSENVMEYTVRTLGEFEDTAAIGKTVIGLSKNGVPVALNQIAEIKDEYREKTGTTLYNGKESILIGLHKEPDKNTIEVSKEIKDKLQELHHKFGAVFDMIIINDEADYIQSAVSNVRNEAIFGALIAFLILLIFLRSMRFALIILISIPVAIVSTFIMMYLAGITINIISMGGLALGVGMLVDNSIAVLESVEIELNQKNAPKNDIFTPIITGVNKVIKSNIVSTFTSVLVFFPIIFIQGIAAELFKDLALTITFSLLSSLVCSLTLAPMLLTIQFPEKIKKSGDKKTGIIFEFFHKAFHKTADTAENFIEKLKTIYNAIIPLTIKNLPISIGASMAMILLGVTGLYFLPKSVFPSVKNNLIEGYIEIEPGTTLEESIRYSQRLENFLQKKGLAESSILKIGYDEDNIYDHINGKKKPNYIDAKIYTPADSKISSEEFIEKLKPFLSEKEHISYTFRQKGDFLESILNSNQDVVQIKAASNNDQENKRVSKMFLDNIDASKKEILAVEAASSRQTPEIQANPDIKKMASFGLQIKDVAAMLKSSIDGQISTYLHDQDREIPVRLQIADKSRKSTTELENLYIQTPGEQFIRLGQVVNFTESQSMSTIYRANGEKLEVINLHYRPGTKDGVLEYLKNIQKNVEKELTGDSSPYDPPRIIVEDSNAETMDSLKELLYTFLLSTVLIYMLIAGQFESYIHPFSVALSIPISLPFVAAALLFTGNTLSIISGMGVIMLAGLAVNNAIVLYEFIEFYREEHPARLTTENFISLIRQAGKERIRPLTLTTLTSVLGLGPMALGIGTGADMQAPLAIVVFFGVLGSSVFTFLFFPVYYTAFEKLKDKFFLPPVSHHPKKTSKKH